MSDLFIQTKRKNMINSQAIQKNSSHRQGAESSAAQQHGKSDAVAVEDNRSLAALQRKQVTGMNNTVQRHTTPVMQLLGMAAILTLSKQKMKEVNDAFGPHSRGVLEAAASTALLDTWIAEINGIHAKVAAAKLKIDNPSLVASQRQADMAEHQQAISERNAKVAEFLATAAPAPAASGAPAWGAGISVARAVASKPPAAVAAPAPAAAAAASAPPQLPALGTVNQAYKNHGDFVALNGATTVTRKGLVGHVKASIAHFDYNPNNGDFVLELGPAKPDGSDWFITVRYNNLTKAATITHFGPFGAKTSGAISKAVVP